MMLNYYVTAMPKRVKYLTLAAVLCAGACATTKTGTLADLNAAFNLAAAAEVVFATQPGASTQQVTEAQRLLSAAQAALISYANSNASGDQLVASAAIAALVAYTASPSVPASPARP